MKKGIFSRSDFKGYQIHANNRLRQKGTHNKCQSITLEMWNDDQKQHVLYKIRCESGCLSVDVRICYFLGIYDVE